MPYSLQFSALFAGFLGLLGDELILLELPDALLRQPFDDFAKRFPK